jgi:hypothetical protein
VLVPPTSKETPEILYSSREYHSMNIQFSSGDRELSKLRFGQMVELVQDMQNGWVRVKANNEIGLVPSLCLVKQEPFLLQKLLDEKILRRPEFEVIVVGIQNSGKTTLVDLLTVCIILKCFLKDRSLIFSQDGEFKENTMPTVGFLVKKVTKDNITTTIWDMAGQTRFRAMWERYCKDCHCIMLVVFFSLFLISSVLL